MNLPINGRIAIIDDQIKHAEPIIKVLSQKQLPHTYFSGEYNYLPEKGHNYNDIRLLFLDINLIDNSEHEDKVDRPGIVNHLKRIKVSSVNEVFTIGSFLV